ncbi:MAG: SMP-30/gluconolactonase/LRE family protein [Cyclobacteriaceae bacterium]
MLHSGIRFFCLSLLLSGGACTSPNQSSEKTASNQEATSADSTLYQSQDFTAPEGFTKGIEGPVVDDDGTLYAVNFQEQGTIGKVSPEGEASLFVRLPEGSIGNGIRFNQAGDMLIADYPQHNILRVNMGDQSISILAHNDAMNQPNDITIMANDILIASDPNWSESTGQLWRITPDGTTTLLEADMGTTNGVEVSPDEKTLYVNESVQRVVWAYDLSPEGEISNKRELITFPDHGMDGMRCDQAGNLYIARHGKGTVAKVSPEGEILEEITLTGKLPSNIAFGGPDGRTVYVPLQDRGCFEMFRVEEPGRSWQMR